ncbi:MAG: hypothetical protein OEL89_01120 [Candidatus Peregrinibacteria bacterium]|nr:hypothetical protein [Candidatus Peregrinibacteria bacterium]
MFANKLYKNEDGFVLVFLALTLPILFLVVVLVIDGGQFYRRHAELNNLAIQSANSGILEFSETLKELAEENYNTICVVSESPAICSSTNMFDFLSSTEIFNLVYSINVQEQINDNVLRFGIDYDPQGELVDENFTIDFPYNFDIDKKEVFIKVGIKDAPSRFFEGIMPTTKEITTESVAKLSLE